MDASDLIKTPEILARRGPSTYGVSIILFCLSGNMHDSRPWLGFGLPDFTRIAATEEALDEILADRDQLGRFIVDDAVASLRPSVFTPSESRIAMAYSDDEIAMTNAMIFQPVRWLDAKKRAIIASANLHIHYEVRGTSLMLLHPHGAERNQRSRPSRLDQMFA